MKIWKKNNHHALNPTGTKPQRNACVIYQKQSHQEIMQTRIQMLTVTKENYTIQFNNNHLKALFIK